MSDEEKKVAKKKAAPKKKATTKKKTAPKKKAAPKVEQPALTEAEALAMAQQLADDHFAKKEEEAQVQKKMDEMVVPRGLARRHVRYRLFRIRAGNDEVQDDLKEYIQMQFKPGMSWDMFTFTWDVSPADPLKVITEDQWTSEGGHAEPTGAYVPPGFTRQAM